MSATKTMVTTGTLATAFLFGGIVLYMNLSSIAKNVTEKIATETLGVPVHIQAMDISLPEKSVKVAGVRVANPKGYSSDYAAKIGNIVIELGDLAKDQPITFNTIAVSGLEMNVEIANNDANLNVIRSHATRKKDPNDAGSNQPKEQRKVIIKNLNIGETKLNPILNVPGADIDSVTMPSLRLRGIGEKENGILAREAIAQIWSKLSTKAVQTTTQKGFVDKMKNKLGQEVEGLKGLFGN